MRCGGSPYQFVHDYLEEIMLLLFALPIFISVALMHRYLATYAPTNLLVRQVRTQEPRWNTTVLVAGLAIGLLVIMHVVAGVVANGAPGWLNLVVLVLAWDAIKLGLAAALCVVRRTCTTVRHPRPMTSPR